MSVWEFSVAMQGYADHHHPDGGLKDDEADALWAAVQAKMGRVN